MAERLISRLAHVEVLTPKPDESLRFYTDVLGLEESGPPGDVVSMTVAGIGTIENRVVEGVEPVHVPKARRRS